MKKLKFSIFLAFLMFMAPVAANAQHFGVNTNVLGWAYASPNLGVDVGLSKHFALTADALWSPFEFSGKSHKFWAVQPELRFYPRYRFAGHFIGAEGHFGNYDFGMGQYRYLGNFMAGCGLTYGYNWILGDRWNLEASVGLGYTCLNDKEVIAYDPVGEKSYLSDEYREHTFSGWQYQGFGYTFGNGLTRRYLGLSRVGITFTYFIF